MSARRAHLLPCSARALLTGLAFQPTYAYLSVCMSSPRTYDASTTGNTNHLAIHACAPRAAEAPLSGSGTLHPSCTLSCPDPCLVSFSYDHQVAVTACDPSRLP